MADVRAHSDFWRSLPKWFSLVKQWFIGEDMVKARLLGLAAVGLSLTTTILLVQVSYAQRAFINALSEKDVEGFYKSLWYFLAIIIAAVFLATLNPYVEAHLELAWRTHMTNTLCKAFFNSHTHYRVVHTEGVDNPDQRISQDVANFVVTSTQIILKVTRTVFDTVAFGGVLWSISHLLVWLLIVYTFIGTWLTASVFGRKLMNLKFLTLKQEADMRFALVRVREYSESISFYNGQDAEAAAVQSRFNLVLDTIRKTINLTTLLVLWRKIYDYATILVPPIVIAPRYFAGEVKFGVVTQLEVISGLAAETDRLHELFEALQMLSPEPVGPSVGKADSRRSAWDFNRLLNIIQRTSKVKSAEEEVLPLTNPESKHTLEPMNDGPSSILRTVTEDERTLLAVRGLHAHVPLPGSGTQSRRTSSMVHDAYVIANDLSFTVQVGDSLLIMGPSGCGKSSLLRIMAGLWTQGSGSVQCAAQEDCFFLPQKAYMPLGTLRQQLLFPQEEGQHAESDDQLRKLAAEAHLHKLAGPGMDLNSTNRWAEVFSVGEQQRIAFARLLRLKPRVAFLDEATSALDVDTEKAMYQLLTNSCQGFVSVGHRPQLLAFHSHVLRWEEPGKWSLTRNT